MDKFFRLISHRVGNRLYTTAAPSSKPSLPNVEGLSRKCLDVPPNPVGPGASKSSEYKNPEYFSYNKTSYFEAEIEMLKFRLPQPSSLQK